MHHFFKYLPPKSLRNQPEQHPLVQLHEPAYSTNEGSEFLYDAIRMEDLPIMYTEESIAPGSPKNLL
jgi:hypothetical protein